MYVLVVYYIGEKRVTKVLKTCRRFLDWVQYSVFEGEITKANYEKLKNTLRRIINKDEDSIRFYCLRTSDQIKLEILGIDKKETSEDGII